MTQDDFKTWTGETSQYTESEWTRIVAVASARLASFLCLEEMPNPIPDDLQMVLANFICAMNHFKGMGEQQVSSKSVRNFTISFNTNSARNAFMKVAEEYGDIIDKYSDCGNGFDVERSFHCACGGES